MKISQPVMEVIDAARVDCNRLYLEGTRIERALYVEVDKVLKALGGKWNRAAGAHVFDSDVADLLGPILDSGEYQRTKQDLGQFDTPEDLARNIVERLRLEKGHSVLEPSAGIGHIAIALRDAGGNPMCVELDKSRAERLVLLGFRSVIVGDFLGIEGLEPFDRIAMNPPFAGQADILHVRRAADLLKPGGRLVAIMSAGILFRTNRRTRDFTDFLEQHHATIERLPPGSFRVSGTDVHTCIVCIDKATAA